MNGTTRRVTGSDYNYAERLVLAGVPVQHAARMTGVDQTRLSDICPPRRSTFEPPSTTPRRYVSGKKRPTLGPALCRPDTLAAVRAVAEKYELSPCDLFGPSSRRHVAYARHEAMAAVRDMGRLSYPQIGRVFGGRDHTTALSGIRHHRARMACADLLRWAGDIEQPDLFAWAA